MILRKKNEKKRDPKKTEILIKKRTEVYVKNREIPTLYLVNFKELSLKDQNLVNKIRFTLKLFAKLKLESYKTQREI